MIEKNIENFKEEVENNLKKQIISGKYILDRFCLIDETSRKSAAYLDHTYAPFYYYLGKKLNNAKSLIEIGFDLGLLSSSLLISCKTIEHFLGIKEKNENFTSNKIGIKNIDKVYKKEKKAIIGKMNEDKILIEIKKRKWDVVIINEEKDYDKNLEYIQRIWPDIADNGIVISEYLFNPAVHEAVKSFSKKEQIKMHVFKTRYKTCLIQKVN